MPEDSEYWREYQALDETQRGQSKNKYPPVNLRLPLTNNLYILVSDKKLSYQLHQFG
jgi:hypothetical protein